MSWIIRQLHKTLDRFLERIVGGDLEHSTIIIVLDNFPEVNVSGVSARENLGPSARLHTSRIKISSVWNIFFHQGAS